jgi:proline iminopeptidase
MTADEFTIDERMVEVSGGHTLYVHHWGNESASAVIYLHGGPGSGCSDKAKTLFDPRKHNVIFFDQRGCGKSTPYGSLADNSTDMLIEDINSVAEAIGVDTFGFVGGSWGSCLALAYAIKFPERVNRMILRGIFTGRQSEIDFMDEGGIRHMFPDVWAEFLGSVPPEYEKNPRDYHLPRILGDNPTDAKISAYAYSRLEGSIVALDDRKSVEPFDDFDPIPTKIECHYLAHGCFLPDNFIIDNAPSLSMPVQIVQGRYDAVCPPTTAYELDNLLQNSTLTWTLAGHSGNDRNNWEAVKILLQNF